MRTSQVTTEQIIGLLKRVAAGQKGGAGDLWAACREHGISDATYSRWKAQYGGLEVSELRRLRQLEGEIRNLKQIVARVPA